MAGRNIHSADDLVFMFSYTVYWVIINDSG